MSDHKQQICIILVVFLFSADLATGVLAKCGHEQSDSLQGATSSQEIILRFGGDCLLAEHYERAVGDNTGFAFRDFDLLRTANIAMVNLESPVTLRGEKVEKPFNFRMRPRFLQAIKDAGIDVVNIANNHIFDFGEV